MVKRLCRTTKRIKQGGLGIPLVLSKTPIVLLLEKWCLHWLGKDKFSMVSHRFSLNQGSKSQHKKTYYFFRF